MTGVIYDGFEESVDVQYHCPVCECETTFRCSAYYDIATCLRCGKVFEMEESE